jgi:hypothetical protein
MLNGLSTSLYALIPVLTLVSTGCVDAKQSFDDFAARVVDARPPIDASDSVECPTLDEIPDISGEFLLSSRPNLPEDRIIKFVATNVMTRNADGTATLNISAVALKTANLTEVGDPIVADGVEIRACAFTAPLVGTIPGAANPVIPGNNAPINGMLLGQTLSEDLWCGDLAGQAGSLPLAGSTFAAIRIVPGTRGEDLPEAVFKCPETDPVVDAGVDATPDAALDAAPDA